MPAKKADRLPVVMIIVGVLLVGILTVYALQPRANKVPDDQLRQDDRGRTTVSVDVEPDPTSKVKLYTPRYEGDDLTFDEASIDVPRGQEPMAFAVNQFLQQLSFVPADAKVRTVAVERGVATVDFSRGLQAGYGSEDEGILLNGLLTTMSQFEDVQYVKMTVEGESIETLGNVELTDPLSVSSGR